MLLRRWGGEWLDGVSTVGGAPVQVRNFGEWVGSGVVYDDTDDTTVDFVWTGAQAEDGIVVTAGLDVPDGALARLAVSPHQDFSADVVFGPEVEVAGGLAKLSAAGLGSNEQYHCAIRVENTVYLKKLGRFRTLPPAGDPASFVLTFGSCSEVAYQTDSYARMQARDPIAFIHLGDWLYPNYTGTDASQWIDEIAAAFGDPARSEMHRQVPTYFIWDDHDFGSNDSYGLEEDGKPVPFRQSRLDGYRRLVPHPVLASEGASSPIYYHVDIGRVRLVVCDGRSTRHIKSKPDDGTKSMLGAEQVAWLKTQFDWLAANQDRAMIWANTMPWIGAASEGADYWAGYATERAELVDYLTGVTGPGNVSERIVMISGDAHMLAYDDGTNASGGIRVCHAAPLGNSNSQKGGPYSGGVYHTFQRQYGALTITDEHGVLSCKFTGHRADTDAAILDSGEFDLVELLTDEPGVMAAPSVINNPAGEIVVSFIPPTRPGNAPITQYDLRHSADEANWATIQDISSPYVLAEDPDIEHYIQVRAVNSYGAGPWSPSSLYQPLDPGNVVIDVALDGDFDVNNPALYSSLIVTNGDLVVSDAVWGDLDIPPGGIGVLKTASYPTIYIPLDGWPAGTYRVRTKVAVGVRVDGRLRDWAHKAQVVAVTDWDRVESKYVTAPQEIPPNDPGAPYAAEVDYTWPHDGDPDRWLMFLIRTSVGGAGGGDLVLADRLLITRED